MNNVQDDVELDGVGLEEEVGANTVEEAESLDEYFAARQPLRVVYQTSSYFLPQIAELVGDAGKITLRPEYQRRLRWSNKKKSALIESMLLNMPVPPIYLYETAAARYEVMDGQQRINAIREFVSGDLKLVGLQILRRLNGLRRADCPESVLRALDRANISAIVLLHESGRSYSDIPEVGPRDLRRLVFGRLNTGGANLNSQEIRHAMNPGPLNDALVRMSRLREFTEAFRMPAYDPRDEENSERTKNTYYKSMKDCELALRFVALRDENQIRGAMRAMLDRAMATDFSEADADRLVRDFRDRLRFLTELFAGQPFQIESADQPVGRVYEGMYDASMIALDSCWARRGAILPRAVEIREELRRAFEDDDRREIITGRRNTARAVQKRISLFKDLFLGVES